ncbi:MAG: glycosyltransferase family 4 protein [Candidatus Krumholzibacteriia bacterium]
MPRSICFVGHLMLPVLTGSDDAVIGGAEVQSYHLAEEMQRRAWEVSFLVCAMHEAQHGVLQTRLGPARVLYPRRLRKSPADKLHEKRRTFGAVRRTDSDLIFQRAVWDADVCALAARLSKRPFVYSVASDRDAVGLPRCSRRRAVLRLAAAVIAQSDTQRDWLQRYGCEARVIPTGFPVPEWREQTRDEILWVGTLRALKRPEIVLDLAEALPEQRFVLCGGPGEDPELAARIERRARRIVNLRFEGFVPYARIHEHFARARVLVNTSRYEGFPNTFVLAWLHGAVVASLGVDPDGLLADRGLGLVGRDPVELLNALRRVLEDDATRRAIAARARRRAELHHDIRRVGEAYEEVFESTLGRR